MQPEGRVDEGGSPTAAEVRQVRALWPWVAGPTWAQKLALAIISLLALGPLVVLVVILRADPTPVRVLVEADATPDATRVTVTALSLAPSSGELRARLLVEPGPDLLRDDGRLERTIALVVNDARGSTERRFDEGTRPDPFEVTLPVAEGSVDILDGYCGDGYGIPTREATEAIELFARTEGLLLDPVYSGKAAAGLIDVVRRGLIGDDERVVFLHTGGAPGLFAYSGEFR
mgnify:CR=1 FL=1